MRRDALETIDLYCTRCRTFGSAVRQHRLALVAESTEGDYVLGGRLECPHCAAQFPIMDGVPCLLHGLNGGESHVEQYLDAHYGPLNAGYWEEMTSSLGEGFCLDAGCSVGRFTFEAARRGFAVSIDVNLAHLRTR
jgi:uncharacterized protein YbaR (Trm112 family)